MVSVANVLHCENPLKVEDEWIDEYELNEGDYDVTNVDRDLAEIIPTPLEMALTAALMFGIMQTRWR